MTATQVAIDVARGIIKNPKLLKKIKEIEMFNITLSNEI